MSSFQTRSKILIAGGAGYIGSHTVVCLIEAGYDVTVIDNLVNASEEGLTRIKTITGCDDSRIVFHKVDLCDKTLLEEFFQKSPKFEACIHFAGLKAVGESVAKPLLYYNNNLISTLNLLELMDQYGCKKIVFSSSATVYGPAASPITETTPAGNGITNPYGRTKYMIEEILQDYKRAAGNDDWGIVTLRYFNPVGAHPSGLIGEDPHGIPNNLMPFVSQVAVGRRPHLNIFGNDYPTKDGTGIRDYIHVMDLAAGHVAALKYMDENKNGFKQYSCFNLGTGNGQSVLEVVEAMRKASGQPILCKIAERRHGDIDCYYADPAYAAKELGWSAKLGLDEMCQDVWKWISNNPNGYAK